MERIEGSLGESFKDKQQKEIAPRLDFTRKEDKDKADLQKILSILYSQGKNNKGMGGKTDKDRWDYIHILGETVYSTGDIGILLSTITMLGAEASSSIKGLGMAVRASVDIAGAVVKSNEIKVRDKVEKNFENKIKNPPRIRKMLNHSDFLSLGIDDNKSIIADRDTINPLFHRIIDNICKDERSSEKVQTKKLRTAIAIREYFNNLKLRKLGKIYMFVDIYSKKSKNQKDAYSLYKLNLEKIPESVKQMKIDLLELNRINSFTGGSKLDEIGVLEKTIKKLQLIVVFENLKKINTIRNRNESQYIIIDSLKVIGDVIGTIGMVGLAASGGAAFPATASLVATSLAARGASSLFAFAKKKYDSKWENNLRKSAKNSEEKVVNTCNQLIGEITDKEVFNKYPLTFFFMSEAIKEVEPKYKLGVSAQEQIVNLFENKIKKHISRNKDLKEEWDVLKEDWEKIKNESALSKKEQDMYVLGEKHLKEAAKLIIDNIKTLDDLDDVKTVDQLIDTFLDYQTFSQIILNIGLEKSEMTSIDFIKKVIKANKEAEANKHIVASEGVSEENLAKMLWNHDTRMKNMMDKGVSGLEATAILASKFEEEYYNLLKSAQIKAQENSGVQQLAVLQDMLFKAMMKMV